MRLRVGGVLVALVLAASCGDDGGSEDASSDAPSGCSVDADCDDAVFCNGSESCQPASADADGRGCVAGSPACPADQMCDEAAERCIDDCAEEGDQDGDGHLTLVCGGDDCDDADPNRFTGNVEVCDTEDHDEDCDLTTFGPDGDGDGFVSDECCNLQDDRTVACGRDCDDTMAGTNPSATDGCGGGDEDCDRVIDEEPDSVYYRDEDNDTYGDDADTVMSCALPVGYSAIPGDCQDDPAANPRSNEINPGATEICDMIDNNCDMAIDEGLMCACSMPGMMQTCGPDPALDGIGICRLGMQTCQPSGTFTACTGNTNPTVETCNSADDDCDNMVDETVILTCYLDADGDGFAALGAVTMMECTCPMGFTDREPIAGMRDTFDCNDDPMAGGATMFPGATEVCNRIDDDCDGTDPVIEDRDDDGFTAIGFAGCTGGFPKTDCFDNDASVRPNQPSPHPLYVQSGSTITRTTANGYCPVGCLCDANMGGNGMCRTGPSACVGACTGTVPPSWDYNCDGVETPQVPFNGCSCIIGTACTAPRPVYSGSAPACGAAVRIRGCGPPATACGSCFERSVFGPMPCR